MLLTCTTHAQTANRRQSKEDFITSLDCPFIFIYQAIALLHVQKGILAKGTLIDITHSFVKRFPLAKISGGSHQKKQDDQKYP